MRMTVDELLDMFLDRDSQEIGIWDDYTEEVVYEGLPENCPDKYLNAEVHSIDNLCREHQYFIMNINTADDDEEDF